MLSFVVLLIIAVTKFTEGAWVVVVILPLGVLVLLRLHRQYVERGRAARGRARHRRARPRCCAATWWSCSSTGWTWPRPGPSSTPARCHPTSSAPCTSPSTPWRRPTSKHDWSRLGLSRLPLDIIECPDRRLARAALELAAETAADGDTELTILLPRRGFAAGWRRLLHDRTADRIAAAVGPAPPRERHHRPLPAARVAGGSAQGRGRRLTEQCRGSRAHPSEPAPGTGAGGSRTSARRVAGTIPIGEAQWRAAGPGGGADPKSVRVPTGAATANLECMLVDGTGAILLVFQGRRRIPGIQQGARLVAQGMVGAWEGRLAILNPDYELIAGPETKEVDVGV